MTIRGFLPGSQYLVGDELCTVVTISLGDGEPSVTVRTPNHEYLNFPLLEAVRAHGAYTGPDEPVCAVTDEGRDRVTDRGWHEACDRAEHIREVLIGSRTNLAFDPKTDNAAYDPARTTEAQRMSIKGHELRRRPGFSRSQLHRMRADYLDRGVMGLVSKHHIIREPDPREGLLPETLEVVQKELLLLAGKKSRIALDSRVTRVLYQLQQAGINDPKLSPSRIENLVRFLGDPLDLDKTAKTRGTTGSRRVSGRRATRPSMPGERIEIDATPLNHDVFDPETGATLRPTIVSGICMATGIMHVRLVPGPVTGRDVRLLIWDILRPVVMADVDRSALLPLGLPTEILFGWTMHVGALTSDHGREMENLALVDICLRLGIRVDYARTKKPDDKGRIEASNRSIVYIQQLFDGYLGDRPENRGSDVKPTMTFHTAKALLKEWVYRVYPHRPHKGQPAGIESGKFLTPAQAYERAIVRGGYIDNQVHPDDVFSFLDSTRLVVSSDGVHFRGFRYNSHILNDLRMASVSGKVIVRRDHRFFYDLYDRSRIFFRKVDELGQARWHVISALHSDDSAHPPFSDQVAEDYEEFLGRMPWTKGEGQAARSAFKNFGETLIEKQAARYGKDRFRVQAALPDPIGTVGSREPYPDEDPIPDFDVDVSSYEVRDDDDELLDEVIF